MQYTDINTCKIRIKPEFQCYLKPLLEHQPRLPYRGRSEKLTLNHIRHVSYSLQVLKTLCLVAQYKPDASREAFSQFLLQCHASLEFLPKYLVPGIRVRGLLLIFGKSSQGGRQGKDYKNSTLIEYTCPRPCSWTAFWNICSLFPVSIKLSIVYKVK